MTTPELAATDGDALCGRLAALARRFPQAEIARRTGASANNVSRYLRGTRIPLEFGAALVRGLGVNPTWLLTGEGTPMLADVSGATVNTAGALLALVEAMNAAARMRLGALAGKHHLRVLRELNDALARFEELREKLNKQTAPVFGELLEHYHKALRGKDYAAADSLRSALTQVARLSDDTELTRKFLRMQGYHEHLAGDPKRSAELMQRAFQWMLPHPELFNERALFDASNCGLGMHLVGRMKESRAVCGAALMIAKELGLSGDAVCALHCTNATATVELGELRAGLEEFGGAMVAMSEQRRGRLYGKYLELLMIAGFVDYHAAMRLTDREFDSYEVLRFALWVAERDVLEHACEHWGGIQTGSSATTVAKFCNALREVLAGNRKQWRAFLDQQIIPRTSGTPDVQSFELCAWATQLARAAGRKKRAQTEFDRAARVLDGLPPGITPTMIVRGTHHRNALELGNKVQQREARDFFKRHVELGYRCFAHLVDA